jgi:hypothetical protein
VLVLGYVVILYADLHYTVMRYAGPQKTQHLPLSILIAFISYYKVQELKLVDGFLTNYVIVPDEPPTNPP